jgi:DnaJ-class molecular chaperone
MRKDAVSEAKCEACNGTGFPSVRQPSQPGRRIYPVPCEKCGEKGACTQGPKGDPGCLGGRVSERQKAADNTPSTDVQVGWLDEFRLRNGNCEQRSFE